MITTPRLGRFMRVDTLVPDHRKGSPFDMYAYEQNNPIRYNDPSGNRRSGECEDGVVVSERG